MAIPFVQLSDVMRQRGAPTRARQAAHLPRTQLAQRASDLARTGMFALHGALLLSCLCLLAWNSITTEAMPLAILALGVLCGALALTAAAPQRLPAWLPLALDGCGLTLLLAVSGGASSPLAMLALLLVAGGMLGGSWRTTLIGTGLGVGALASQLLLADASAHMPTALAITAAAGLCAAHGMVRLREILVPLGDLIAERERADAQLKAANEIIEWQRQALAAIVGASDRDELRDAATICALRIAAAPVSVVLPGEIDTAPVTTPGQLTLVLGTGAAAGRLVVHAAADAIESHRRAALGFLGSLLTLRAAGLDESASNGRTQTALRTLWEIAGVLRTSDDGRSLLQDSCQRVAVALGLEWLALLGPSATQPIAQLLMARGHSDGTAPRLHGAQLRVAAESLRCGRTLVRAEDDGALVFMPLQIASETPLVLAARGDAADASAQLVLLLFGSLVTGAIERAAAVSA